MALLTILMWIVWLIHYLIIVVITLKTTNKELRYVCGSLLAVEGLFIAGNMIARN